MLVDGRNSAGLVRQVLWSPRCPCVLGRASLQSGLGAFNLLAGHGDEFGRADRRHFRFG